MNIDNIQYYILSSILLLNLLKLFIAENKEAFEKRY